MAVALLALFVALGGSAYAVDQINGNTIKNRTIGGAKLKNDTLTGKQIKESKLGKVPSAAKADTATSATSAGEAVHATSADSATTANHATSADQVGGLTAAQIQRAGTIVPFDVRMTNTQADQTLVQAGPFTVKGHCELSGGAQNFYQVYATTTENDAAAAAVDTFNAKKVNADFDVGSTFVITQDQESGTPPAQSALFPITASLQAPSGTSLTLELVQGGHLFNDNASAQTECTYAGFAVVG
jgi:hypothetical protein